MNKFNAIIFDLDGVITDTAQFHYLAWKELADSLNIDFTKKDNEKLKGVSRVDSLQAILKLGNVELTDLQKQKLLDKKNACYLSYIDDMAEKDILPGVSDLLSSCRKKNLKLGIGSASKNTKFVLDKIGLATFFDAVVDGLMVENPKPNPEVFLKGAEMMIVDPAETVVVEDAEAGLQAARAGGFFGLGVGKEKLPSADFQVESTSNLTLTIIEDVFALKQASYN